MNETNLPTRRRCRHFLTDGEDTMKCLNDFPAWREAHEKLTEIQIAIAEAERHRQHGLAAWEVQQRADKLTHEAERYLSGSAAAEPSVTREQLEDLSRHLKVLRRAEQLQRDRIAQLQTKLSDAICKEARPAYQQIIRDLAKAAHALAQAAEVEICFREALHDGGVSFTGHLPPVPFRGVGRLNDPYSRVNQFFTEATDAGYLSARDLKGVAS